MAAPTGVSVGSDAPVAFGVVNGVRLAYVDTGGAGDPLVLVHGSWGSHRNWDAVVPELARRFRVLAYDRRGHSDSDCPPGQGGFAEDVADLAALIEARDLAPAWVVGNSAGAVITLKLAAARPELLRGIMVHEPPLWSLLAEGSAEAAVWAAVAEGPWAEVLRLIEAGDHAGAAELFVDEVALGPGSWARMPEAMRQMMTGNAPTYLDEARDASVSTIDVEALAKFRSPTLITSGDQSPVIFGPVLDRLTELLPQAVRVTYAGAGHIPHVTHPEEYVTEVFSFTA